MEKKEQWNEIVGKVIEYTRTRIVKVNGIGLLQIPSNSYRYLVQRIVEIGQTYIEIEITIDDEPEETTILLEPNEMDDLLAGNRVNLFQGYYKIVD